MNAISSDASAEDICAGIISGVQPIALVFQGISDGPPAVRFRCSKSLMLLSEENPSLIYPDIEKIFGLSFCFIAKPRPLFPSRGGA
jgi:hypothetical protein